MEGSGHHSHNGTTEKGVQDRLLEAAEALFCGRGFNETSVRDIAAAADCNIASVNYYFGGKENLYVQVWRRRLAELRETRLASIERVMSGGGPPQLEDLLRSYANSFIEPLVPRSRSGRFVKLLAREMVDPHLPSEMFVTEMIVPVTSALSDALRQVCPWLKDDQARLAILSMVGQMVHAVVAKGMFEQSNHPELLELNLDKIVDHIVKFSAAGIRAYENGAET